MAEVALLQRVSNHPSTEPRLRHSPLAAGRFPVT